MRILIAGAGIAGLTLSAMLEKQGHEVALIDKSMEAKGTDEYPLVLWPHGARVLNALGLYGAFLSKSTEITTRLLYGSKNKLINLYDIAGITRGFAAPRVVQKSELLKLLRAPLYDTQVNYSLSVTAAKNVADKVEITLSDGSETQADLLLCTDGRGSFGRSLVGGAQQERSIGWSAVVGEAAEPGDEHEIVEHWRAGYALTLYPGGLGKKILLTVPSSALEAASAEETQGSKVQSLKSYLHLAGGLSSQLIDGLSPDMRTSYALCDHRLERVGNGRIVLVGDAAISYLPGSEVGASMALESAAVLAEELSKAPGPFVDLALRLYAKRRKKITEYVQNQSRAIMAFELARAQRYARIRDTLVRFHDMRQLKGPKIALLGAPM